MGSPSAGPHADPEMACQLPPGSTDCHMHVYGPESRFPVQADTPLVHEANFEHYMEVRNRLGIERTVYVQPSAYGRDHACLLDAMRRDPSEARGIAIIGTEGTDASFRDLHAAGVRGVRFHSLAAGCLDIDELEPIAAVIAEFGWHVQVQIDGDDLCNLEARLQNFPCDVVIDHMGRIPVESGLERAAFRVLMRLLEAGRCWVKLSAPYHVSQSGPPNYEDCAKRAEAMITQAPHRLVWGSNWPHPTACGTRPEDSDLLFAALEWCGGPELVDKVFVSNPAKLFDFTPAKVS